MHKEYSMICPKSTNEKALRLLQNGVTPINVITMEELYDNIYAGRSPVIENLLYTGFYVFAGAPKTGKSFLAAQLAYHISTGTELWGRKVYQGTVLYMALEDDEKRIQDRMFRMFGTETTDKLFFSFTAEPLNNGLSEQIKEFLREHPETKLIIIDTLQKVRPEKNDSYSYSNDYKDIGELKKLADESNICIIAVHHTRKQLAEDAFSMISGTNGILGAADGAFVLHKEKRASLNAVLEISGRDQPDQRIHLSKHPETLIWEFERIEEELWNEPPDELLEAVAEIVTADTPQWTGTATELAAALSLDMQPNTLSMRLNVKASVLLTEYGIQYTKARNHNGRVISLKFIGKQA